MHEKILEYLCVKCKKKHKSQDIAFCLPEDIQGDILDFAKDSEVLEDDIIGKIHENRKVALAIRGSEVERFLSDIQIKSDEDSVEVSGILSISLSDICKKAGVTESLPQSVDELSFSSSDRLTFRFKVCNGERIPHFIRCNYDIERTRCCPECGQELCHVTGFYPEINVILQGSTRAGKTAYLCALGYKLDPDTPDIDIRLKLPETDPLMKELREQINERFSKGLRVVKTDRSNTAYAYSFECLIGNRTSVFTLIDMPGECFDIDGDKKGIDKDWIKNYLDLYQAADCIWTVIDKLTLCGNTDASLARDAGTTVDIIALATAHHYETIFSEIQKLNVEKMPPSAVLMTKVDLQTSAEKENLKSQEEQETLFPFKKGINITQANTDLVNSIYQNGCYQERSAYLQGKNIKDHFFKENPALLTAITTAFPSSNFFAVSSYGHNAIAMPEDAAQQAYVEALKNLEQYKQDFKKAEDALVFQLTATLEREKRLMQLQEQASTSSERFHRLTEYLENCQSEKDSLEGELEGIRKKYDRDVIDLAIKEMEAEAKLDFVKEHSQTPSIVPPTPYGIELPLLWTLAITNKIPIQYLVSKEKEGNFLGKVVNFFTLTGSERYDVTETHYFEDSDSACKKNMFLKNAGYSIHSLIEC